MKFASLRTLTWGTVSAAVGSALLLAANGPEMLADLPGVARTHVPGANRAPAAATGPGLPLTTVSAGH